MKIVSDSHEQSIDLDVLIEETFQKHSAVFFSEIDGQLYSYRPLGRKEYKDILTNECYEMINKPNNIPIAVNMSLNICL